MSKKTHQEAQQQQKCTTTSSATSTQANHQLTGANSGQNRELIDRPSEKSRRCTATATATTITTITKPSDENHDKPMTQEQQQQHQGQSAVAVARPEPHRKRPRTQMSAASDSQQHIELVECQGDQLANEELELRREQPKQKRPARGAAPLEPLAHHHHHHQQQQEQQQGQRTSNKSNNNMNQNSNGASANATNPNQKGQANVCAACSKPIKERYLLVALDKQWHEDCLKCACCDCRLGEVGSSLFTHSDKILCRRDFLRIFGQPGHCAACKRQIPPYELVMRANELAYHMDCFACQQCQYRFCVGDRYHLIESHKIICLLCHSERQAAAAIAASVAQQASHQAAGLLQMNSSTSAGGGHSLGDLDPEDEEEAEADPPQLTQLEPPPVQKAAPGAAANFGCAAQVRPGEVQLAPGLVTVTVTNDANGLRQTKTMAQLTAPPRLQQANAPNVQQQQQQQPPPPPPQAPQAQQEQAVM